MDRDYRQSQTSATLLSVAPDLAAAIDDLDDEQRTALTHYLSLQANSRTMLTGPAWLPAARVARLFDDLDAATLRLAIEWAAT